MTSIGKTGSAVAWVSHLHEAAGLDSWLQQPSAAELCPAPNTPQVSICASAGWSGAAYTSSSPIDRRSTACLHPPPAAATLPLDLQQTALPAWARPTKPSRTDAAVQVKVIGVETVGANAMAMSLAEGRRCTLSRVDAFADGTAVKQVCALAWAPALLGSMKLHVLCGCTLCSHLPCHAAAGGCQACRHIRPSASLPPGRLLACIPGLHAQTSPAGSAAAQLGISGQPSMAATHAERQRATGCQPGQ